MTSKITPTLMFPLRDLVHGESATLLTYSESTGAFSYSSSNPNVAFISGNTITAVSIGLTTITINQAEDNNYNAAQITSLLYVHPSIPMIMFEAKTNGVYYNTIELLAISTNPYSPIIYGFVNNPEDYLSKSHLVVLPSLSEGFGIAVVEAMQLGIACLCSNVGGIPEFITHNENGWLFNPNDESELVGLLNTIIKSPFSEIEKVAQQGMASVENRFSVQQYVENLENLYIKNHD